MTKTKAYRHKRDFDRTREPRGTSRRRRGAKPGFVVQEHDASTHHFDFRLEVNGVLVSWAVPKGPSTDPREKRLAIRTEDHPLDYGDFEGVIPKGQYGGGTVLLWDRGCYDNLAEADDGGSLPMEKALTAGHLLVDLHGEKLSGGYALQRIRDGKEGDEQWLLVKVRDEDADARRRPARTEPQSVASGRTLAQVREEQEKKR